MQITHPKVKAARERIYSVCAAITTNPQAGRTVVLYGENGAGKTHVLKRVGKWMSLTAQLMPLVKRADLEDDIGLPWPRYAHWPSVIDQFQKHQEIGIVEELMQSTVCLLDDIGAEHDPSGFGREQLYLILSRREFKWNIITTNCSPNQWHDRFERRIASRLFRNAEHVDLSEVPDYSTT